jgi:hypothetical protein
MLYARRERKGRQRFFFEKKEAKNVCEMAAVATTTPQPPGAKVFLLLFL